MSETHGRQTNEKTDVKLVTPLFLMLPLSYSSEDSCLWRIILKSEVDMNVRIEFKKHARTQIPTIAVFIGTPAMIYKAAVA